MAAKKGDTVKVEYTGTLDNGAQFDTSVGKEPITFKLGSGEVIPGFENALEGMSVGQEKTVDIVPEQAYGPHHAQLVQEVPKDKFPPNVELKKGIIITLKAPTGQTLMAKVADLKGEKVTLDLNHPLAGQTLHFKVKLVGIL
ncbi:peptidylprolyl isomerase [Candidatus Woesearchaeota archaeon]|nr:peptidylprolyl isomerase [Candidatus Woesearchaeota archaeon]